MKQKVNIGLIGCGHWAPNIIKNLLRIKDCCLVCILETNKQRAKNLRIIYPNVFIIDEDKQFWEQKKINAVIIASPASTHYALAKKALNNNWHTLVEKPLALKSEHAKNLARLAKQKELIILPGHTFLYEPAVLYLKQIIKNKKLGKLLYIHSERLNLGRLRSDVDALWNFAPHDLSIINFLLENKKPQLNVKIGKSFIQKGINDTVYMHLKYKSNILATIFVSWLHPQKTRKMTIVGTKKMAIYNDVSPHKILIYNSKIVKNNSVNRIKNKSDSIEEKYLHQTGRINVPLIKYSEPLENELTYFLHCIKNKINPSEKIKNAIWVVKELENSKEVK